MPYYESELQGKFVRWLQQLGYHEVANDVMTNKGTSMDSVGFIGNNPILIEIKHRVSRNGIRHAPEQGGSIEQKIARGLQCLYGERNEPITAPLAAWNRKDAPHIYLVANHISNEALQHLKDLLHQRAQEWWFSYSVYLWNNDQPLKVVEELVLNSQLGIGITPNIPDLSHQSRVRERGRSMAEFQQIAASNHVTALFDAMLRRIKLLGGIDTRNRRNLNFRFPQFNSESQFNVIGIWPANSSNADGLLVSYSLPEIERCFGVSGNIEAILPGKPVARIGHLGKSRYLRTVEEVNNFWDSITGVIQRSDRGNRFA